MDRSMGGEGGSMGKSLMGRRAGGSIGRSMGAVCGGLCFLAKVRVATRKFSFFSENGGLGIGGLGYPINSYKCNGVYL